ncbi:PREDICTED: SNF-related serine/threonine-protein kinase-like isoform X2 [Nicrophorus vespilloides]|uniref:SNF-related serine/threonine-protein kinase-like isoform X2 n=1 Tax=Nicrophorus vespilloides TaxID=110193 RepID=A0ABM1MWG5_NICVS|nr:PREDICTED: SNF-related serine/threonine-protein kinase-like isoform X2 [Nicrophorus vespilloides]
MVIYLIVVTMHRSLNIGGGGAHMRGGVYDGKIAGLYDLEETLGRGHFAVVKLARHVFTGEKVAVKVIDKSKLDDVSKAHLFQEVRCMKLVQHPNVVRLYEVIDTATKLYLILELGDGGDLYDYIMRHDTGLSEVLAQEYFRQIVRAITYCHQLHVVHRDLKPENVVFFQKLGVVKLTDFGFSNKFCPGQKLETSCGSLAYSAPEILLGDSYDAPAVDVWSLGVILYMLVCGQAPFQEANDSETLTMIMDCKYTVPTHVSKECKDLIAKMLVRAPEKRATLSEISAHAWLATNNQDTIDILPLVSKEQLSEEDHNLIVQKIVNGNIATKEEIQDCLDKNEYNHITATYFLLAERKLRSKRQEIVSNNRGRRPDQLAVHQPNQPPQIIKNTNKSPAPSLLSVPRTPGDVPQRSRKCSIVQEDEEEEDISSCSGREELSSAHTSLNRRGSRSEGRLNLALQERIAESERRKEEDEKVPKLANQPQQQPLCNIKTLESRPRSAHEAKLSKKPDKVSTIPPKVKTTIITESSTITIPIVTNSPLTCQALPKYRTMPSPIRTQQHQHNLQQQQQQQQGANTLNTQLNEIFEEGDCDANGRPTRQFVSRNRATYEQRRSKFHKTRTASCSSSDASDDDSENRKKRAHKIGATAVSKPSQHVRRDSHDDSSDSQEPGAGATAASGNGTIGGAVITNNSNSGNSTKTTGTTGNTNGGRKHNIGNSAMLGRRHKASRRRSGETRLRESQSLNRITEEDGNHHTLVITGNLTASQGVCVAPKVKSFGARFLQGFGMSSSKRPVEEKAARKEEKEKENKLSSSKKMRLLGRYFQVHKRIFVPIPGLFSRSKLYKARSCGSLKIDEEEDGIVSGGSKLSAVGSTGDINQNKSEQDLQGTKVLVKNVRDMCVHLGHASKCSFC